MVVLDKEYMKLNGGKIVDIMTRGSYILIDSVKSRDDYYNFVHNIEIVDNVHSGKTNPAYLIG